MTLLPAWSLDGKQWWESLVKHLLGLFEKQVKHGSRTLTTISSLSFSASQIYFSFLDLSARTHVEGPDQRLPRGEEMMAG